MNTAKELHVHLTFDITENKKAEAVLRRFPKIVFRQMLLITWQDSVQKAFMPASRSLSCAWASAVV